MMTNYEKIKSMSQDELARFLDDVAIDEAPWNKAFDEHFCKDCPAVKANMEQPDGPPDIEMSFAWCEVFGYCKFFSQLDDTPSHLDVLKWWLNSNSDK